MRAIRVGRWVSAGCRGGCACSNVEHVASALGVRLERANLRGPAESIEWEGRVYVRPDAGRDAEQRALAMGAAVAVLRAMGSRYAQADIDALALEIATI